MDSNFSLSFGLLPSSYINREYASKIIYDDFSLDFPLSHMYIISGVRGSGKTVLLASITKKMKDNSDWIIVDVNPNRDVLEQVAAGLYENSKVQSYCVFDIKNRPARGLAILPLPPWRSGLLCHSMYNQESCSPSSCPSGRQVDRAP